MKEWLRAGIFLMCAVVVAGCAAKGVVRRSNDYREGMKSLNKGSEWYLRGCHERAIDQYYRALERFAVSDEQERFAACLNNIGNTYRSMSDPQSAHRFFDEALRLYRDMGNPKGEAQSLSNKAAAWIDESRLEDAEEALRKATAIVETHGFRFAPLWRNQGVLHLQRNEFDPAFASLSRAEKEASPNDPAAVASVAHALGLLKERWKDWPQAVRYYQKALEADRRAGFHEGVAGDLAAIGRCLRHQGNLEGAVSALKRSIRIYALIGKPARVQEVLSLLEESAGEAGIDISLTRLFVGQWIEGKRRFTPCN